MWVFECIFIVLLFFKCTILIFNADYVEDGWSAFFKKRIFGSVLSDENYMYLLLMFCGIIDRIVFWCG